jgi:hypothetical protein
MQIVIDIDEESYEHIKAYSNEEVLPIGWYAIINGTPLPKGHGRLIDADELPISHGVFVPRVGGEVILCAPMDAVFVDEIKDAPTIIEGSDSE